MTYFLGVDVGQPSEPTALAVVESDTLRHVGYRQGGDARSWSSVPVFLTRKNQVTTVHPPVSYALSHLERLAAGLSYAEIAGRVRSLAEEIPDVKVCVGVTGLGEAIVSLVRSILPTAVYVSLVLSGTPTTERGVRKVPKKDVVSIAQVLLQDGRLKIARGLEDGELLAKELLAFRWKPDPRISRDAVEAFREGASDDLVLALSGALWLAEKDSGIPTATTSVNLRTLGRLPAPSPPSPWDLIRTGRLPGRP